MTTTGHAHHLHVEVDSPTHRLPPQVKIAAMPLFIVAVVATPRESFVAFGIYAVLVYAVVAISLLPPGRWLRRTLVVVPFVVFAAFLPFFGPAPVVHVAGLDLSLEGLWAGWSIVAKAWLGAAAAVVLASTTPIPDMLGGFERLRVPGVITAIAGFMVRYLNVVVDETRRARTAMAARGYEPRWFWQAGPLAALSGALFIRSYERGERVFTAMLSRGFDGTMPGFATRPATIGEWAIGLTIPAAAWLVVVWVTM